MSRPSTRHASNGARDAGRGCLAVALSVGAAITLLWAVTWVTSFDRTTSDRLPTLQERVEWAEINGPPYGNLPSAALAPLDGEPADSTVVFDRWSKSYAFLGPSTRTLHVVARVPPDSLDAWHRRAWGWVGPAKLERGLPINSDPETEWLATLPPGPPTDGLTEWYGGRRAAVGIDRARGIVAYRESVHDTHRRARWWWPFWDY